jgi:hypothetical protein
MSARGSASAFCVFGILACGAASGSARNARGPTPIEPRDTHLVHEDCPVGAAGTSAEDINGDGRPDRRTVSVGARPLCRALDFDFDGVVDAWVYLDEAGQLRRRENDFDRDGNVDEVSLYAAGVLIEQRRSTSRALKLDTWHYFNAGKLARSERDSNGDDYIDQWWEYPDQRTTDCPLIHSDVDGDGRPDPGATVDVCRDRYGAEGQAAQRGASGSTGVSEAPTEVETHSSEDPPGPAEAEAPGAAEGAPDAPRGAP